MSKIAILGSSFSAIDFDYCNQKSWSYYLAKDYPHIRIDNFARSAHGFDYSKFILDWMIMSSYRPDLIIIEVPYLGRKFNWLNYTNKQIDELYDFTQLQLPNLFQAETVNARILYCSEILIHDEDNTIPDNVKDVIKTQFIFGQSHHAQSVDLHIMQLESQLKMLPYYEEELGCPIFYYTHGTKFDGNYSNFSGQTAPEFMEHKVLNYKHDLAHFNSIGNEYLYNNYIKANTKIRKELDKL